MATKTQSKPVDPRAIMLLVAVGMGLYLARTATASTTPVHPAEPAPVAQAAPPAPKPPVAKPAPARVAHIPAYTPDFHPAAWAVLFLHRLGYQATACRVTLIVSWERVEGGGVTNMATWNPLNTIEDEPGDKVIPHVSVPIKAYTSRGLGLAANVAAISNPFPLWHYRPILAAIAAQNPHAFVAAVLASSWGTQPPFPAPTC